MKKTLYLLIFLTAFQGFSQISSKISAPIEGTTSDSLVLVNSSNTARHMPYSTLVTELSSVIGGGGGSIGIENVYLLSSSTDFETAITDVQALNASENKQHLLVIDEDVNLTGTPRTITVPSDVPVYVQRGFKFITPLVDRDHTGVNDTDNSITLTGTSGTATLTIDGVDYTVNFVSDLSTSANSFVVSNAALILSNHNLTVTANGSDLEFNGAREGFGNDFGIVNATGDISGTLAGYTYNLNSISGTVADNYIQIQFEGRFYADKIGQVFEGDGLIWFDKNSVQEVWTTWWGLESRTQSGAQNQTTIDKNVKAFQQAANCIVLNKIYKATSKLRLPNGRIYLDKPIVFYASTPDEHPYLTGAKATGAANSTVIQIEGSETVKHGLDQYSITSIYYQAKWGSPLVFQALRNSEVKKVNVIGQNNVLDRDNEWLPNGFAAGGASTPKIALRPDRFETYDLSQIAWIKNDIIWGYKRPYSAIMTDPFKVQYEFSKITTEFNAESIFDLYLQAASPAHQNSWDVLFENIHISNFVEGFAIGIQGQQNDTYVFRDIMVENICFGISIAQDQSRDCKVYDFIAYSNTYAAFDTSIHGDGVMPEIVSFHSAGGMKYIHYGQSLDGITNLSNMYLESIYGVGVSKYRNGEYNGFGVGDDESVRTGDNFGASITNSTLKFGGHNTYTVTEGTAYVLRPPTVSGFNIYNSSFNNYDNNQISPFNIIFKQSNLYGVSMGEDKAYYHPIDAGWFSDPYVRSTVSRNMRVGGGTNSLGKPAKIASFYDSGNMPLTAERYSITESVRRTIEDNLVFKDLSTSSETITLYPTRHVMAVTKTFDDDLVSIGDFIRVEKGSIYALGVVVSNDETTLELAYFSEYEWLLLLAEVDGSNQMTGVNMRKMFFGGSFRPFVADLTNGSNTITILDEPHFRNSQVGWSKVSKGDYFILPDGKRYFVLDQTGTTITIDRNYDGDTSSGIWVKPEKPSWKNTGFIPNYVDGSTYYLIGEKLDYYSSSNTKAEGYVICVKEGKYYSSNTQYNADFLRYDNENNLIAFINGATNTEVVFNISGTTAQRPDQLGVPLNAIPNGYVYYNITTDKLNIYSQDSGVFIEVNREPFEVPTSGLILEWLFDNSLSDTSSNANDLTGWQGTAGYTVGINGEVNSAAAFPVQGVDYSLFTNDGSLTNFTDDAADTWSFNWWVKKDSQFSGNGYFFDLRDGDQSNNGFSIRIYNSTHNVGLKFDGTDYDTTIDLTEDVWQMVTLVKTGAGTIDCYLNGVLEHTLTGTSGDFTTAVYETVGGLNSRSVSTPATGAGGDFDNFRMYNKALNTVEILGLYDEKTNEIDTSFNVYENTTTTGTETLDLDTLDTFELTLTGNTTLAVSNTPAVGKSKTISGGIESSASSTLTFPVSWNIYGVYLTNGTRNKVTIEFTNTASGGLVVDCFINQPQ